MRMSTILVNWPIWITRFAHNIMSRTDKICCLWNHNLIMNYHIILFIFKVKNRVVTLPWTVSSGREKEYNNQMTEMTSLIISIFLLNNSATHCHTLLSSLRHFYPMFHTSTTATARSSLQQHRNEFLLLLVVVDVHHSIIQHCISMLIRLVKDMLHCLVVLMLQ